MATRSKFTITITKTANSSTVQYSTKGRYGQISTNTLGQLLRAQPLFTTSTPQAYWVAVLNAVLAAVTAGPPS